MTSRQVLQSDIRQGVDEEIAYSITTTPWGSSPTSVVITIYDVSNGGRVDVTSTVMTGSATVSGDVITLPLLKDLTEYHIYRVEVRFTADGNIFEPYFIVVAEL